jgi:hypothetical protein
VSSGPRRGAGARGPCTGVARTGARAARAGVRPERPGQSRECPRLAVRATRGRGERRRAGGVGGAREQDWRRALGRAEAGQRRADALARVRSAGARQQGVNAARMERSERVSCDAARVARGASVRARSRAAERRGASALGERRCAAREQALH